MGKVGRAIFGGGKSTKKEESGNLNNELIKNSYGGSMGATNQSTSMLGALLGGDTSALQAFADSGGQKFLMDEGNRMINSNQSAKGLLDSGSTLKAITKYGQGLASTRIDQYLDSLYKLGQLGLGAGGLVTQAGQYSKGKAKSTEKKGILPAIGEVIPG